MTDQLDRFTRVLARSLQLSESELVACFRPATPDDIAELSALRKQVFGSSIGEKDELYLQWRYFERPNYESTLYIFEYRGQVIGALGTEPVELWYQGKLQPALRNLDAIVNPQFDNRGLGAWMSLVMQSRNNIVIASGSTESSDSMLRKLFTPLPARNTYKIIFDTRHFVAHKTHSRLLGTIAAPVINFFTNLYLTFRWQSHPVPAGFALDFNENVSALVEQISDPLGTIGDIKVARTPEYLQWRFAENPSEKYHSVCLLRDKRLIAYVIYKFRDSYGEGQDSQAGYIIDWQQFEVIESIDPLISLLVATLKDMRRCGCQEVSLVLSDNSSRQMALAAGFVFRHSEANFFVFNAHADEDDTIFDEKAWYYSLGDTDTA